MIAEANTTFFINHLSIKMKLLVLNADLPKTKNYSRHLQHPILQTAVFHLLHVRPVIAVRIIPAAVLPACAVLINLSKSGSFILL
jgi:hypothetical protein